MSEIHWWLYMSKYNAKQCEYDGYKFGSEVEMRYYKDLKELQEAGEICGLEVHPKYLLQDKFIFMGEKYAKIKYEADFAYYDPEGQAIIVIDVKGMPTESAKIKRKMFINKWCLNNPDGLCMELRWECEAPRYTGLDWIDYFELIKLRKKRKKDKNE